MPWQGEHKIRELHVEAGSSGGTGAPRRVTRASGGEGRDAEPLGCADYRRLCLLIRRWNVLRSMPAALAAAEILPSWRARSSRRYEASSTAIHLSLASFSGISVPDSGIATTPLTAAVSRGAALGVRT